MKFRENDVIVSIADISPIIRKGTKGIILSILEEEYKEKRAAVPDEIEIQDQDCDITIKTRSLAVDIGIYFGEVFIKNHEGLKWEQYFSRSKYDMNIEHMVIKGFGKDALNSSIWVIYILASGLAKKTKKGTRLYELYNVWKQDLE